MNRSVRRAKRIKKQRLELKLARILEVTSIYFNDPKMVRITNIISE